MLKDLGARGHSARYFPSTRVLGTTDAASRHGPCADCARVSGTAGCFAGHLNPVVREVLLPPLAGLVNVVITDPLSYSDFCQVLSRSTIVLTDSGGVQEEAPSLGKPVY